MATWREHNGCSTLIQQLLEAHIENQRCRKQSKKKQQSNQKPKSNIQACKKKLSCGNYTAFTRILSSNGVASSNADTLHRLQLKHPHAPPPIIPDAHIEAASVSVDTKDVLTAIKSFPKGTSCGRDGIRAQHLLDALSGSAAAVSEELLSSITAVVNLWLSGKCPKVLGEYIASAPLIPLLKPDGGLRPLAIGTIWRRLCSKVAVNSVRRAMTAYLGNYQFGVGVPCGGEGIMHSANKLLEMKGTQTDLTMLLIDFQNAFNLVERTTLIKEVRSKCPGISSWVEFCYTTPTKLYFNEFTLPSANGVHQGDPLGPLLFALTLHPLVCKIAAQCYLDLHAWYLNDGTMIGDTLEVSKSLNIIQKKVLLRACI